MSKIRIILLSPFSIVYGWITAVRNFLFDRNLLRSVGFDTPIIGVGNLSAGGTGKTPHVLYLVELLKEHQVAVLSRGYGRKGKEFLEVPIDGEPRWYGDEPLMMKQQKPYTRFFVCADRVVGFTWLMGEAPETQAVILDDAYQHRYIKPSFQILLTTWDQPFCRDFLLPSGMLRESRSGAKRTDLIIVTKCPDNLIQEQSKQLVSEIARYSNAPVCFSKLRYDTPVNHLTRETLQLTDRVVLVSGLARAQDFATHATQIATPVFEYRYPDHHTYNTHNLNRILDKMKETGAKGILTTEKDYVKFRNQPELWQIMKIQPVYVLKVAPEFIFGGEDVVKASLANLFN